MVFLAVDDEYFIRALFTTEEQNDMSKLSSGLSRYWLIPFIFASILIVGCKDSTINGPASNEGYEKPEPDPPDLELKTDCETKTLTAISKKADEYLVTTGQDTVDTGVFPDSDSVSVNVPNGQYNVSVTDTDTDKQSSGAATLDCDQDPVGPGSVTLEDIDCMEENPDQGFAIVQATRGFERWRKENLDTGLVEDSSGFTPETDQTYRFEDLNDQDYEFTMFKGEGSGTVQGSPNCDPEPKPPVARFTYEADELDVSFDASNSSDPDHDTDDLSFDWEFGDDESGSGISPSHTYPEPGTYDVTLTVEDPDGLTDSVTKEITVDEKIAPTARFSFEKDELDVSFDASNSSDEDGKIVEYGWEFGDGESGSGIKPDHEFPESGTYDVTLTVEDDDGLTGSTTKEITVDEKIAPTARFTFERDELKVGFDATRSNDPDGEIVSYDWQFGDGSTGSGVTPSHVFPESGYYDVTLIVEDDDGLTDSVTKTLRVEKVVLCTCTVPIKSGDKFVAGKGKFDLTTLSDEKEMITGPPTSDWIRIQMWIRISQGEQLEENFAPGFLPKASSDTLWADIVYDKDNTGSGERWVLVTIEVPAEFLETNKLYSILAAHSHYFGKGDMDGLDSVWFRDDDGNTSLNLSKSTKSKLEDEVIEALEAENNAPATVMMPKSGDPGFRPADHEIKVQTEMLDKYCPESRQ
jgi:PKD repeat protein